SNLSIFLRGESEADDDNDDDETKEENSNSLPGVVETEYGTVDSRAAESYARVSSERVNGGLLEKILHDLHEEVQASDRRYIQG
ncbi:hypothetical protein TorRG33x02_125270, partial [Trema orientale]